jgi:hypothetical protein
MQYRYFHILFFLFTIVLFSGNALAFGDPTVSEILQQHLKSVGVTTDANARDNRIAIGKSEFALNLPEWHSAGKAIFASSRLDSMLISSFDLPEYPFEKVGFFRGKVEIPFITPGTRSPMGSYLLLNDNILNEHLFGGVISVSWRMFDAASVLDRLKFGGRKKVNGRESFVIKYNARGNASSDSNIDLDFDAKDFRHLRTEYRQTMPDRSMHQVGTFGNQMGESRNTLVEEFDDFRTVDGLTLPYKYTIKLTVESRVGTKEFRWTFKFDEYRLGQNFGEDFFSFDRR